jgi:hypothetical protein
MRWTRQRFARDGIAGRVERLVSDQQRADERCCSVRRSRVVLTPRRWRQVRGVKSAQPGLDKTYPQATVAKQARSPGRARRKPLKPLRAGTSGDSGVLVVTRVRSTNTKCTRDRGCNGHPAFPTPSLGGRFINASGASRREDEVVSANDRCCLKSESEDRTRNPGPKQAVIPGRCEASNPESRDSGSAPGGASRNDGVSIASSRSRRRDLVAEYDDR